MRLPRRLVVALALSVRLPLEPSPADAQSPPSYNDVPFAVVPLDSGGSATLRMNIWRSTSGAERSPLLMWIHGGGWQSGTYDNPPPGLNALLAAGFAVASVEYRLSGVAIFPAQIHDVKGATRFLRAHADDYGVDASRVAAWGSSAGGHLTALLAMSGGVAALEGTTGGNLAFSSTLQAAVDYFGPTDLLLMTADFVPPGSGASHDLATSPESRLIGFDGPGEGIGVLRNNLTNPTPPFPEKAALVMLTNSLSFVDAADPPTFIAHGTIDGTVPIKQSQRLADALAGVGVDHVMRSVIGAGHGFGTQTAAVNSEAIAFLSEHMQAGDFDDNGMVDGADFLVWQRTVGSAHMAEGLDVWIENFGNPVGGIAVTAASAVAVPEPTALSIARFALFAVLVAIGRRQL